jgi:hypothetical protein
LAASTERIVVLMTPSEKRALERKAKRLGASTAELVRRSVDAYDPEFDEQQIRMLLTELAEAHERTLAALDRADREMEKMQAYFAAKAAGATEPS